MTPGFSLLPRPVDALRESCGRRGRRGPRARPMRGWPAAGQPTRQNARLRLTGTGYWSRGVISKLEASTRSKKVPWRRPSEANQPDQLLVLPASLHEWLPRENLVYFVSDVVQALDLSAIYASYEEERTFSRFASRMSVIVVSGDQVSGGNVARVVLVAPAQKSDLRQRCQTRNTLLPAEPEGDVTEEQFVERGYSRSR